MFNTSNKLFDQIFELKFTAKQLVKESKRCEAEEKANKTKAKKAMEKGEGGELYDISMLCAQRMPPGGTASITI